MPTPTKAVLDFQSDLKRTTAPVAPTDVANKAYVDATAGSVPDATSAPGGGVKGKVTFDDNLGLHVAAGIASVKVDGTTVTFDGTGHLQSTPAVPTATSAPGGGTLGKVTADENKGLKIAAGILGVFPDPAGAIVNSPTGLATQVDGTRAMSILADKLAVKVDGTTVQFDGGGNLKATTTPANATSANGGGVVGVSTFDEAKGLHITPGPTPVAQVKVDGTSMTFDGSGNLKSLGGTGPTGLVSNRASFARAIIAGPPTPTNITLGNNVAASSYPDGVTTGERFEFTVPDDYFTGNIDILILYKMSAAVGGPNNQIRITTAAEIAKVTGSIDSATYPTTPQSVTTPTTTNIVRAIVLSLLSGSFEAGDDITISIQRLGADGADLSTADWQVIAYEWRYTAIVNTRLANQVPEFLSNAVAEGHTVAGTIGTQTDVEQFPTTPDAGLKFTAIVPDNWDSVSPAFISVEYSMSSAVAGQNVELNTYGEIADSVGGTILAIPSVNFTFSPPNDANPHRLVGFASIPANLLAKGNHITSVLARRTAVGTNHPGSFRLIGVTVMFAVAPASGFSNVAITEAYLAEAVFGNTSGGPTTQTPTYPVFGSTFDKLYTMASSGPAGRVDAAFAGRLATYQTQIDSIRVNIIGTGATPQYHLQVYAEGTGLVYDSGLQPAPLVLTELVVLAGALSAQPTGSKRYHAVVQAFIDTGESVAVSLPFARQL